jgi:hypothetical protein
MKATLAAVLFAAVLAAAQNQPAMPGMDHSMHDAAMNHDGAMSMEHHHMASGPAVSYEQLKTTVSQLDAARKATERYRDVRAATADGYVAMGPDVPGMGIHYVLQRKQDGFLVEQPPILLYERNADAPGGFVLVGVSYLLEAPEGTDGQPANAPFPTALAKWHRHENLCVMPDHSTPPGLDEAQCKARGGEFHAETQWMVHAWIWKESPLGVFSPTNPSVR